MCESHTSSISVFSTFCYMNMLLELIFIKKNFRKKLSEILFRSGSGSVQKSSRSAHWYWAKYLAILNSTSNYNFKFDKNFFAFLWLLMRPLQNIAVASGAPTVPVCVQIFMLIVELYSAFWTVHTMYCTVLY
jgi:hypothetical protein